MVGIRVRSTTGTDPQRAEADHALADGKAPQPCRAVPRQAEEGKAEMNPKEFREKCEKLADEQPADAMIALTYNLKLFGENAMNTPTGRAMMLANRKFMLGKILHIRDILRNAPTGPIRAALVAEMVDEAIKLWFIQHPKLKADIKCKSGCSNCCHIRVTATPDEAQLIIQACEHDGIPVDWDTLSKQVKFAGSTGDWVSLQNSHKKCVFLKSGQCQIYPVRPASCRAYMVSTPPSWCLPSPSNINGDRVGILIAPEAEIVISASYNVHGGPLKSLPEALLEARGD